MGRVHSCNPTAVRGTSTQVAATTRSGIARVAHHRRAFTSSTASAADKAPMPSPPLATGTCLTCRPHRPPIAFLPRLDWSTPRLPQRVALASTQCGATCYVASACRAPSALAGQPPQARRQATRNPRTSWLMHAPAEHDAERAACIPTGTIFKKLYTVPVYEYH